MNPKGYDDERSYVDLFDEIARTIIAEDAPVETIQVNEASPLAFVSCTTHSDWIN